MEKTSGGEDKRVSISDIRSRIENIVSNLRIIKLSGDNQKGRINKPLAEWIIAKVVYDSGKKQIPVHNFPMVFSFKTGKGRLEKETSVTNMDGTVKTRVEKVEATGNITHTIRLAFDSPKIFSGIPEDSNTDLSEELQNKETLFSYNIPILFSNDSIKIYDKKTGIKSLVSQIVNNMKDKDLKQKLKIAVLDFIELMSRNRLRFSNVIESDIKTTLALVENLDIAVIDKEIDNISLTSSQKAHSMEASLLLTGGYYIRRKGIEINAKLLEVKTGIIISAGHVIIKRENIHALEFITDEVMGFDPEYASIMNKLITAKPVNSPFDIKIWTDKKEYIVGEEVTFQFKSEKACYLTIIDIGTFFFDKISILP